MCTFKEALDGMKRGEMWRRATWRPRLANKMVGEDFEGVNGAAVFEQHETLKNDWERYEIKKGEEAKKTSLTFYQAMKCKTVRIYDNEGLYHQRTRNGKYWGGDDLTYFDMAERRASEGWRLVEVK